MPSIRKLSSVLELQETSLCSTFYHQSWIYSCRKLMCSKSLDEAITLTLWSKPWSHSSKMWQHKCDQSNKKNLVMHSRTKHIEIRHHFLKDHMLKVDCCIEFIDSEHQLTDVFTKPLARDRFFFVRNELDILDASSIEWHSICIVCDAHSYSYHLFMFSLCLSWLTCVHTH